jgi:hypothetical protein
MFLGTSKLARGRHVLQTNQQDTSQAMCKETSKWSTRVTPLPSFSFFLEKLKKKHTPCWGSSRPTLGFALSPNFHDEGYSALYSQSSLSLPANSPSHTRSTHRNSYYTANPTHLARHSKQSRGPRNAVSHLTSQPRAPYPPTSAP